MMKNEPGCRDSFVVRVWRETGSPEWRGWVQHARTGESAPIRKAAELLAFIEQRTGRLGDSAPKGLK